MTRASIATAIAALNSAGPGKFKAAKRLVLLSQKQPGALYDHFDALSGFLGSENKIIQWSAFQIISHLAPVDHSHCIDELVGRYLRAIKGPSMITAAHAVAGAARIAAARPDLLSRITSAILKVETGAYGTLECKHIAIGHALEALRSIVDAGTRGKVRAFARRQMGNPRPGTRRRAERLLKALEAVAPQVKRRD